MLNIGGLIKIIKRSYGMFELAKLGVKYTRIIVYEFMDAR